MFVAPITGKYVFTAHIEHCDDTDNPTNDDHVDEGHTTHDVFVDDDVTVEYVPATQGMH